MRINAERQLRAPVGELFDYLADLENHWVLTGGGVSVLELAGPPGARTGGTVRIQGPLGPGRIAETRVIATERPQRMLGTARLETGTTATVSWTLGDDAGGARVVLAAEVERTSLSDRLLLLLGGRWWRRRLFRRTLSRLGERFAPITSPPGSSAIGEDAMADYTRINLKQDVEDQAPKFGYAPNLESRFARVPLRLENSGLSHYTIAPDYRIPFGHAHSEQEEVYLVLGGTARVKLDDEVVELGEWDAVRVPPGVMRGMEAGANGAEVLAFGAPNTENADIEMEPNWWTD